jgi:N-acetyltransferase 10
MVDYHMIVDLLPTMASHYFLMSPHSEISLSPVQAALLLSIGLQHRTVDDLEKEIKLPVSQLLAMLIKCARKFAKFYRDLHIKHIDGESADAPKSKEKARGTEQALLTPHSTPASTSASIKRPIEESWEGDLQELDEDLDEAAREAKTLLREKQRALINALDLQQYAIGEAEDEEWESELKKKSQNLEGAIVNISTKGSTNPSKDNKKPLAQRLHASKDADLLKKAKKSKYAKK